MPIYEYSCQACGHEFSKLIMKQHDEQQLVCPSCGATEWKRLISRVRFHLSESERIERHDPRARQSDSFYRDSRNIGLGARKRMKELGLDPGSAFGEKLEKARSNPAKFIDEKD